MADGVATIAERSPAGPGKREETKRANRQAILDAARAVFGDMGFEGATVRDIIRHTNLSVGAFYNYYRSKEEVYEALAEDGAERFRPILRAQYENAGDFEGFVRAAVYAFFRFSLEEHEAWRLQRPQAARVRIDGPAQRAVFDEVKAVLTDGVARGLAPAVDADYLAAACIGIAREVCEQMIERQPVDIDAATDFVVRMILGGVAALPRIDAAE